MIISEYSYEVTGMNQSDAELFGYRNDDGSLTHQYLGGITAANKKEALKFEIALNQFHYHFPFEGKYRISWKIERLDNDHQ